MRCWTAWAGACAAYSSGDGKEGPVNIEHSGGTVRIELKTAELRLLRLALERALFIDTPPEDQADILTFCTRALEALPPAPARPAR